MENKKEYGLHPDVLDKVEKELHEGFFGNAGLLRVDYPSVRYMTSDDSLSITFFGPNGQITSLVNYLNNCLPEDKKMEPLSSEKPY